MDQYTHINCQFTTNQAQRNLTAHRKVWPSTLWHGWEASECSPIQCTSLPSHTNPLSISCQSIDRFNVCNWPIDHQFDTNHNPIRNQSDSNLLPILCQSMAQFNKGWSPIHTNIIPILNQCLANRRSLPGSYRKFPYANPLPIHKLCNIGVKWPTFIRA